MTESRQQEVHTSVKTKVNRPGENHSRENFKTWQYETLLTWTWTPVWGPVPAFGACLDVIPLLAPIVAFGPLKWIWPVCDEELAMRNRCQLEYRSCLARRDVLNICSIVSEGCKAADGTTGNNLQFRSFQIKFGKENSTYCWKYGGRNIKYNAHYLVQIKRHENGRQ